MHQTVVLKEHFSTFCALWCKSFYILYHNILLNTYLFSLCSVPVDAHFRFKWKASTISHQKIIYLVIQVHSVWRNCENCLSKCVSSWNLPAVAFRNARTCRIRLNPSTLQVKTLISNTGVRWTVLSKCTLHVNAALERKIAPHIICRKHKGEARGCLFVF